MSGLSCPLSWKGLGASGPARWLWKLEGCEFLRHFCAMRRDEDSLAEETGGILLRHGLSRGFHATLGALGSGVLRVEKIRKSENRHYREQTPDPANPRTRPRPDHRRNKLHSSKLVFRKTLPGSSADTKEHKHTHLLNRPAQRTINKGPPASLPRL